MKQEQIYCDIQTSFEEMEDMVFQSIRAIAESHGASAERMMIGYYTTVANGTVGYIRIAIGNGFLEYETGDPNLNNDLYDLSMALKPKP